MAVTLEAKNVRKYFGEVRALDDGNLKCEGGNITGLIGANGSGKSTLCKIIVGVHDYDTGTVFYQGRDVQFKTPGEAREHGVAIAYQNLSLMSNLSVWENITLGNENTKGFLNIFTDDEASKSLAKDWIDRLSPGIDLEEQVANLRPGDKQIVEIAKAMSTNPEVLILDEPTAALERTQVDNLFKAMKKLADEGTSVVFISHRLSEVMEICDEIVVLRDGKDVGHLKVKESKEKEIHSRLVSLMTGGEEVDDLSNIREKDSKDKEVKRTVLKAENLEDEEILNGVSFEMYEREILGIGGLAGQGQEELLLALSGFREISSGKIIKDDKEIDCSIPRDVIQNGIALVPGDKSSQGLLMKHRVVDNVVNTRFAYKNQPIWNNIKSFINECQEVIKAYSIDTPGPKAKVKNLSGGNQQKVVFGKWYKRNPDVLMLSDPAKGVDVKARREMYEIINKLVMETKMSVLLYASDFEELVGNCDRVMVMYEGEVVDTIIGDDINQEAIAASSLRIENEGEAV